MQIWFINDARVVINRKHNKINIGIFGNQYFEEQVVSQIDIVISMYEYSHPILLI